MGVLKNASNDCFYFVLCNIKVSLKKYEYYNWKCVVLMKGVLE